MIPYEVTRGYGLVLDQLSVAALADLRALTTSLEGESPERTRAVLFEAFPEVFNPYAAASSAVSASFYEEVREMAEVKGAFSAEALDSVESPRWYSLVGAGTAPSMFEQGGAALIYSFLSGGLTSILTEMAADTIVGNAALDPAPMGYQRVPKAGCCAFCGMLASRGAAYSSKEAAGGVVGRGMPVGKTKGKRGGQARGIRPRGSRQLGESFHDHCQCRAVPVNPGNSVQMQEDADKYYDSYADAREKVSSGQLWVPAERNSDGSRVSKGHWVDAEGKPRSNDQKLSQMLASMRQDLGVK